MQTILKSPTIKIHPDYHKIDNEVYHASRDIWWDENSVLYLLKTSVNPARFGYFKRILEQELQADYKGKSLLDVGCGGGILAEEFAAIGMDVTGIDPSVSSLETARQHAALSGLDINYRFDSGENISFSDASFDYIICCDVLEHVKDLNQVISEISRVLKPGGVFFYDTLNRTFPSWLVAIKIWQEWKRWAFMPPNLHVWKMFIKPKEIITLLKKHGFENKGLRGMIPSVSPLTMLPWLRKRAKGIWTYKELSENLLLVESKDTSIAYMGYAVKK